MSRGINQKKFGEALLVGRLKMGVEVRRSVPMREVAKKLGVSSGYLGAMENGLKLPNIRMLRLIGKVYPPGTLKEVREALGIE